MSIFILFILCFDGITEACLSSITNSVSQRTEGQYLALLSSDHSPASLAASMLLHANAAGPHSSAKTAASSSVSSSGCIDDFGQECTGVQYVTPTIVIGLLIVAILLIILFIGICCVMSIQTPLRYATPSQKLVIGKEY
jgi:uncharacterized membrane protein